MTPLSGRGKAAEDSHHERRGREPALNLVKRERRRKTLIAQRSERDGEVVYTFDIHLQSDDETVFMDI